MAKSVKIYDSTKSNLDDLNLSGFSITSIPKKIDYLEWFHKTFADKVDEAEVLLKHYERLRNENQND